MGRTYLFLLDGLLLLLSQNLLHNLLFLNQKSPDNSLSDANVATRSTISTGDGLLSQFGVFESSRVHVFDLKVNN